MRTATDLEQQSAANDQRADAGHQHDTCGPRLRPARPFPQHRDRRDRPEDRERPAAEHRRHRSRAARARAPRRRAAKDCASPASWWLRRSARDRDPPSSGAGPRGKTAEPAFAAAIFGDRAFERGAVEVRPVGRHENELAIGRLPQQEIRQPLLAAGADDEIGIGQIRRVEEAGRALGGDRVERRASGRDLVGEPLRRARDLLPRAVIEGDDQRQAVVAARQLLRLFQQAADIGRRDRRARRSPAPARCSDAARRDRCG